MKQFQPDYRHIVDAAYNREAARLPLYEHGFDVGVVEAIMGFPVQPLLAGSYAEKVEAYRRICAFALRFGYDCIPFEHNVARLVQDGLGIRGQAGSIIHTLADVENYPWNQKLPEYIRRFQEHYAASRLARATRSPPTRCRRISSP